MGTIQPVLTELSSTLGTITSIQSQLGSLTGIGTRGQEKAQRAQQDLALQQLQQTQANTEREAQQKAARDRERLQVEAQQNDQRRRQSLRRSIARQNARVGASDTSRTGSNEAVLLGLINDTEDDRQNAAQLDQLRFNTIDSGVSDLQQRNVLQRTQLAERQRLEREIAGF